MISLTNYDHSEIAVRLLFSPNKGYQKEPGRSLANYDHVLPLISSQFSSTWSHPTPFRRQTWSSVQEHIQQFGGSKHGGN